MIKKILVPTDFSKNADNALKYAVAFAFSAKAKIILVHGYDIAGIVPYTHTPSLVIERNINANKHSAEIKLKAACTILRESNIECDYLNRLGSGADVILQVIKRTKPDLVVMGTKGASGLKKVIMGSQTASVIEKSKCPVIAVPEKAVFNGITKIGYATDYNKSDLNAIKKIVEIATLFNAEITVLHVAEKFDRNDEKVVLEKFKIKVGKKINYNKISFKLTFGGNFMAVIEKYIKASSTNLIAMSTQHRNLIERIFGRSVTKQMSFHSKVPLMAFHHKKN